MKKTIIFIMISMVMLSSLACKNGLLNKGIDSPDEENRLIWGQSRWGEANWD